MIKTIADVFNNPDAIFNDPLEEIHNPVQSCEAPPEYEEYGEFFNNLYSYECYPKPVDKIVHHRVNPLHGTIKPLPNGVIKII